MAILMGVETGLCVLFGILAAVLKHLKLAEPPWVVRVFQGLAVLATILVVLLAGG
jgi:predicted benzoate:H+ symporter BenE